ncbi:MAG: glutamine--fructose-6-phosphate transaminase (isomerizing), partial [Pseudomonadota bacterium]
QIQRRRAEGKLKNLRDVLCDTPLEGKSAIGHIRWATHGAPNERNAHPHATDKVAIVHNGIIENYRELRHELEAKGHIFHTETDSEVIAHMATEYLKDVATPEDAVFHTLQRLEGAFAVAFLFTDFEDVMFGARRGSPLAVGFGEGEMFLGSDAMALAPMTNRIIYLNEGDWCVIARESCIIKDMNNEEVVRDIKTVNLSNVLAEKEGYRHFMLKEIYEQPTAISQTLSVFTAHHKDNEMFCPNIDCDLTEIDSLSIVACGTAYYAGYLGKYYIEKLAQIPAEIEIASEFRYRKPPLRPNHATLIISQSGETADTLAALRYAKAQGSKIISIVNVPESTIVRESDVWIPTHAGPEIGVASTKAFTAQMASLIAFSLCLARAHNKISKEEMAHYEKLMLEIPRHINEALKEEAYIRDIAYDLSKADNVLFLGRGCYFPLALEGALKLKEISYIHAEGYPAGELKHGPIALIDENIPVVVLSPSDPLFEKTASNTEEVIARGAKVILISDEEGLKKAGDQAWRRITVPMTDPFIAPFIATIPLQLLAYHTAVHKGTDIDQPRNLAKSVTVE